MKEKKVEELKVKLSSGKEITLEQREGTIVFPNGEKIKCYLTVEKGSKRDDVIHVGANPRQLRCYSNEKKEELLIGNVAEFNKKYGSLDS